MGRRSPATRGRVGSGSIRTWLAALISLSGWAGPRVSVGAQEPAPPSPYLAAPLEEAAPTAPGRTLTGPATVLPRLDARPAPVGFFAVARESIFGDAYDVPWDPLPLRTLFTEGWDEPWVAEPDVSGDSQQGWINAADGNFYRLSFFSYDFARRPARIGNGQTGAYTIYLPLSRRLELITSIPFVSSQPTFSAGKQTFAGGSQATVPPTRRDAVGFGDLSFTPRVMLIEQADFTLVGQATIQVPTGYRPTGAGQSILTPGLQYWWNFAEGWVVRGGFNAGVGTNRQAGGTTLLSQLAVGKTLTPADTPYLGDFTIYLAANAFNSVSSSRTTATLTPGFRTHLGQGYYALAGLEVPVTGGAPFSTNTIVWIMKTF